MRAHLLDIFKQAYIISTTANEDVGECFNFMEPKEIQIEEGGGNDLGRGEIETGTPAMFDVAPHTESISAAAATDVERMDVATATALRPTEFAKVEKSLASLGFFTPSSRRIKNQKVKRVGFTREIDGKRVEVSAEIHPSAMFGLPVTADQDKYLALQKIITNKLQSDGKVTNPIRFKSSELLRLLNTSTKTGKNYKAISEWLDVMSATTIFSDGAVYVAGQKRFARDRFRVFDRALSFGKEMEDGTIADANYIWLSTWQLENINNKFLVPIDLETYRELKNHISKALVPLLQVWLYASKKAESFEKRYSDLCEILTLQIYRTPSQILRQFKPSLDELTHHGYLASWRIEKTSDKKSYKIVLFHGPKFHRDRRRRLEQKDRLEPVVVVGEFEGSEPNLPEPGTNGSVPASKTDAIQEHTGSVRGEAPDMQGKLVDDLSARGLMPSAVLKLLGSLAPEGLDKIPDYIDYFDHARKGGDIGPGLLYDLIRNGDPLPANFETRQQKSDRLTAEGRSKNATRIQEELRSEYEIHTRQAIDRYIAELPPGEFDRRVAAHMAAPANHPDFWKDRSDMAEQFARHAVRAEIAKGMTLPTYEDFSRRELPRIAAKFELDPTQLNQQNGENSLIQESPQKAENASGSDLPVQLDLSGVSNQPSSPRAELDSGSL